MESLELWLDREYRYAATAMLASVSPVHLVQKRPGFGQTMHAKRGSIVASPVLAAWDPEPDYFFHWYRDSAVVVDALRLLYEDGTLGDEALVHLTEFVRFSLSLEVLDGRDLVASPSWRERVIPEFRQYERSDEDLAAVHGKRVAAEARVNPDGTLDISKWCRPQHDGPPLRAIALLRWIRNDRARAKLSPDALQDVFRLIRSDVAFTVAHWRDPSFDIWEEELGHHYYTLRVAAAALRDGADWLSAEGRQEDAASLRTQVADILRTLDGFWSEEGGYYRARVLASGTRSQKELDISAILGVVHACADQGGHSVLDPRMHSTLQRLEALFEASYAINRDRAHPRVGGRGLAMGRYAGDVYFSGGAYYFSTLGAAEFCFRAAAVAPNRREWIERGDGFLATVQAFTPESGELSEQFDQKTGVQTSARHLAWSYAALISSAVARRAVS
jgi:glucoamylase